MLTPNEIYCGDCRELLQRIESNTIDACVTDPPYELGFMGKHWDKSGIAYNVEMWHEVFRVLKPGAHILAFGGTRTSHRMTCAIEDAGFEIRDALQWLYGSGFPNALDISKAIDNELGADRKIIGEKDYTNQDIRSGNFNREEGKNDRVAAVVTEPATHAAKLWDGWATALKPGHEPITLARKPIAPGMNVAKNVLEFGVGGLNIDGCRIPHASDADRDSATASNHEESNAEQVFNPLSGSTTFKRGGGSPLGRWPSNVIIDEEAAAMLDEQSGFSQSPKGEFNRNATYAFVTNNANQPKGMAHGDSGGASRFFYIAKASRAERDEGIYSKKDGRKNTHPTVKPITLMRYLIRMITPPGGIVLDPFAGSGPTCIAAKLEFCKYIGMDLNPEYCTINDERLRSLQDSLFDAVP